VPLYKYALNGNWTAVKVILENNDERLKHVAITSGWSTLLHAAVGANYSSFVEELLKMLQDEHVSLKDKKGNIAFCLVAATGNMHIAKLLMTRNLQLPKIAGGGGCIPIQISMIQGNCQMTWFMYSKIIREEFQDDHKKSSFFGGVKTGNHSKHLLFLTILLMFWFKFVKYYEVQFTILKLVITSNLIKALTIYPVIGFALKMARD